MGLSALLPLINPLGSAFELLGAVGVAENKFFKLLAKKTAVNSTFLLVVVALAGPYALQFFGISVEARVGRRSSTRGDGMASAQQA